MNDNEFRMIAHRGLHDNNIKVPENSILAFENAISNEYDIELDVRITKDRKVVVFHDKNLKRMTTIDKDVHEVTYDELLKLNLKNTNEKIPLFKDVLNLIDGKCLVNVELKSDIKRNILEVEVSKILDNYKGEFFVKSFNPYTVWWFKRNRPNYIRGQLACEFKFSKLNKFERYVFKNMLFNFITKPHFIAYDIHCYSDKLIQKQLKKGIKLITWTNKTDEDIVLSKSIGASAVVFENIMP